MRRVAFRRALSICLGSMTLVAGCSEDPPPSEPRALFELRAADPAKQDFQHLITFADGATLGEVVVEPATPGPGESVEVRFTLRGAEGGPARVGLLPPSEGARQWIPAMGASALDLPEDPRAQWVGMTLGEGPQRASFELPADWMPRSAIFVLERRASEEGPAIEVVAGPRSEAPRSDGYRAGVRARLASVPVETRPLSFSIPRAGRAPEIDGKLDEVLWSTPGHPLLESLDGEPVAEGRSRVWLAWDAQALYVAAELEDSDIWSEYENRDDPLYRQEAFEVFVAGGPSVERYLEYQVSPRNVIFDAAFQGHRNGDEGFNGMWSHAVTVDGSLNARGDRDRAWRVEAAFPWPELCAQTRLECPVGPGTPLRMNIFRLDKDAKGRQSGQALTPTREPDFHHWVSAAKLTLSDEVVGE